MEDKENNYSNNKNTSKDSQLSAGGNIHMGDIINIHYVPQTSTTNTSDLSALSSEELNDLILNGKIKTALEALIIQTKARDEDLYEEVILQAQRWNRLKKDSRLEIITSEQARVINNRIVRGIIEIVKEL